jgi:hypothetical protein
VGDNPMPEFYSGGLHLEQGVNPFEKEPPKIAVGRQ